MLIIYLHNKIKALNFAPDLYTCQICSKQFKGLVNLYFHERNVKHKIKKRIKRTHVKVLRKK